MNIKTLFAVGLISASAVALAASASATTITNPVAPPILNVSGPTTGTIDGLDVSKPNTYDWTFDIAGNPAGGLSQLQASFVASMASVSEPIEFSLFSGTPGSGTLIDTSSDGLGPSIFDAPLAAEVTILFEARPGQHRPERRGGLRKHVALPCVGHSRAGDLGDDAARRRRDRRGDAVLAT